MVLENGGKTLMSDKPYISIKAEVLAKLEQELPFLREKYEIQTIGLFGSVSRGEDTPQSDIDLLYTFQNGAIGLEQFLDLADHLEKLFGRKVELVSEKWLNPHLRPYVEKDIIMYGAEAGVA